jgi:hypothetical protein
MSRTTLTVLGVAGQTSGPEREPSGRGLSISRFSRERGRRRSRRAVVGVEAAEPRISQSGFAVQSPGVIHGIEDPNERSAGFVLQLNSQMGASSRPSGIIAI